MRYEYENSDAGIWFTIGINSGDGWLCVFYLDIERPRICIDKSICLLPYCPLCGGKYYPVGFSWENYYDPPEPPCYLCEGGEYVGWHKWLLAKFLWPIEERFYNWYVDTRLFNWWMDRQDASLHSKVCDRWEHE